MAAQYPIQRLISGNAKRGTSEVTVDYGGVSVTRHLKGGIGWHPDDTIPALHKRLEERVEQNKRLQQDKAAVISKLSKLSVTDKVGIEKFAKEMAIEMVVGLKPKQITELLAKLQAEIDILKAQLPFAEAALDQVRKEDPLMVRYVLA
jgi:hypothetical protein